MTTTYKSWKHHLYRNGRPLCGTRSRYPVCATSASLVVQLCTRCVRSAGPAARLPWVNAVTGEPAPVEQRSCRGARSGG